MWKGLAPIVPDSYTSTRSGLWTMRARIAAVLGRPTPMNTDRACCRRRAATTVCTSPAVACSVVALMRRSPAQGRCWRGSSRGHVTAGLQHMLAHPRLELLAVAAELVPEAVEVVIA